MNDTERKQSLEEIRDERIKKMDILKEKGISVYPAKTKRTHEILQVVNSFDELEEKQEEITIAGRILSIREHGGSVFMDIFDGTKEMQGYIKKDVTENDAFDLFLKTVDRGDFLELSGTCFKTKRGEPTILAKTWRMLAKSILPIPTEHFGIKDEDERYRKRYLDILLNKELAERIKRRSLFWKSARDFLLERNFLEVETPALETVPGGAEARPFITHHNALDMDVYLRISAGELWQKKLMVAGLPKTFEIGRIFRNEGMSKEHLQDYTQLEFYEAYADFEKGKETIKKLYLYIADKTFGKTNFEVREHKFDLNDEWVDYDFCKIIEDEYGFNPADTDEETVMNALEKSNVKYDKSKLMNKERAVDTLWKKCRVKLSGPGFLVNVPVYLEPLAKRSEKNPLTVERFQVILAGSEVGKGFSELNDPVDQAKRFERQEEMREQGDDEAQFADKDFVEALEYGMPPTFGFGVSERLYSFLEGISVREGQIFPLMRPKGN
jgi:lysyl-tRNA synthetase class 2